MAFVQRSGLSSSAAGQVVRSEYLLHLRRILGQDLFSEVVEVWTASATSFPSSGLRPTATRGDLLSVHQEISCPSAGSPLSAYLESAVSVDTR